jgi:histidine triad (HIT) family protein
MECVFCRIIAGQMYADIIFQDDVSIVFRDIHPQAPQHILIVPKSHIASIAEATKKQQDLLGHLILVANEIARKENFSAEGYRLTINCGLDGGQIVPHLHIHLLGGRRLDDLMG